MKTSASPSKVGEIVRPKYEVSLSPTKAMVEGHSSRASGERAACCAAVRAPGCCLGHPAPLLRVRINPNRVDI
jgi:hypothetical protein